jgi:hypothetical protein
MRRFITNLHKPSMTVMVDGGGHMTMNSDDARQKGTANPQVLRPSIFDSSLLDDKVYKELLLL